MRRYQASGVVAGMLALSALLGAGVMGGGVGGQPLSEPAPAETSLTEAQPGRAIRGRLTPPERVLQVHLCERSMDLEIPLQMDRQTGAFSVSDLRLGTYDLVVRTPWGILEGVDMTPVLSEYDALIPPEYRTEDVGLVAEGELTDEDREWIRNHVFGVERHENKIRILALRGTSQVAVALLELVLDEPFVGREGDEITWRIEKWIYEKKYDSWALFRTVVLHRRRVSKAEWQSWGWQFEPDLGGLTITEGRTDPVSVEFTVPENPSPEKGLAGHQLPPPPTGSSER